MRKRAASESICYKKNLQICEGRPHGKGDTKKIKDLEGHRSRLAKMLHKFVASHGVFFEGA